MTKKVNYDILDLTKVILSFMVVAIHTELFPMILYPWLRIAVPLFFVISSFLLSEKLKTENDKKTILKRYITRLIKLYIFWFIVLLPLTIINRRNWFSDGIFKGLLLSIKNLFFGSTFSGSWYITATILGTLIVYNYKNNNKYQTFLLYTFMYMFCVFSSSYSFILNNENAKNILKIIQPQFTFLSSLIYIYIGKLYSSGGVKCHRKKHTILLIIAFAILLFAEWKLVYKKDNSFNNDCYLFLIPLTYYIFGIIKNTKINLNRSKSIRKFATFVYPFHLAIIPIEKEIYLLIFKNGINTTLLYILTIIISITAFEIIKKLENIKILNFLKYSH